MRQVVTIVPKKLGDTLDDKLGLRDEVEACEKTPGKFHRFLRQKQPRPRSHLPPPESGVSPFPCSPSRSLLSCLRALFAHQDPLWGMLTAYIPLARNRDISTDKSRGDHRFGTFRPIRTFFAFWRP
jgi:hypothetical protein